MKKLGKIIFILQVAFCLVACMFLFKSALVSGQRVHELKTYVQSLEQPTDKELKDVMEWSAGISSAIVIQLGIYILLSIFGVIGYSALYMVEKNPPKSR